MCQGVKAIKPENRRSQLEILLLVLIVARHGGFQFLRCSVIQRQARERYQMATIVLLVPVRTAHHIFLKRRALLRHSPIP